MDPLRSGRRPRPDVELFDTSSRTPPVSPTLIRDFELHQGANLQEGDSDLPRVGVPRGHSFCELPTGEPESLVNWPAPRRYPGELLFCLSWIAAILAITSWILVSMVVPLVFRDPWRYNWLLGILGCFSLILGVYVFQIGIGSFMWTESYNATKDTDWHGEWKKRRDEWNEVRAWNHIQHFVVVTAYKEQVSSLKAVAYTLITQRTPREAPYFCEVDRPESFSRRHITLVLAMEEREGQAAHDKANGIREELKDHFREVLCVYHPSDRPNEIAGKASNYRYAVQEIDTHVQSGQARARDGSVISMDDCLIHVADGDSLYDPNHFPCVTYDFCTRPDRYNLVWQPAMLATCNFWELPFCVRQVGIMIAAQEMMSAYSTWEFQIPFSTYGLALRALQRIGAGSAATAQDGDVIAEDHHLFIKGFFATSGALTVKPVFLPCFNYTVEGCECVCRTFSRFLSSRRGRVDSDDEEPSRRVCDSRFTQATRHMFGIAEFAYFFSLIGRGGICCRRYGFGKRRKRVLALGLKLLKIHSVAYLGLWVTLGIILCGMLKIIGASCDEAKSHLLPLDVPKVCQMDFNRETRTVGAVVFSGATFIGFVGSIFVIVSFVRMLHATQDTIDTLEHSLAEFLRDSRPGTPAASGSPMTQGDCIASPTPSGVLAANLQGTRRLPETVRMNRGAAWVGMVIQLVLEYVISGFVSSLVYGALPSIIAIGNLLSKGHRLKYVSASEVALIS